METEKAKGMPEATVRWEDGVPVSCRFGDVYFSREDGLEEARHVFLGGNRLVSRWHHGPVGCIGELGFGSGLNFLATWQAWRQQGRLGTLRFASVERYPLTRPELTSVVALWPELAAEAQALVQAYPEAPQGHWQACWEGVELSVDFQEASSALAHWPAHSVEAWYLDGFSPRVNPDLWAKDVLRSVFRLTAPGGSAATYTVAGTVRRTLQSVGFHLQKLPGYGRKREMLRAEKPRPEDASG